MPLQLTTIKISGVPSESGWSQSFEYTVSETKSKDTQSLVIVFSTGVKSLDVQSVEMGREFLKKFHDSYFEVEERNPALSLKDAANKVFNDFFQNFDGLEIACAAYTGGSIYVSAINGAKVSLYRDKFLVSILDSAAPKLISASGHPEDGDTLILSTSAFSGKFPTSDIKKNLDLGLDALTDEISLQLHDVSQSAVALMAFGKIGEKAKRAGFISDIGVKEEDGKTSFGTGPGEQEFSGGGAVAKKTVIFEKIGQSLKNFGSNLSGRLPRRRIFLHVPREVEFPVRNKKVAFIGVVFSILLIVSVTFGLMKKSKDDYRNSYEDRLIRAEAYIDDAVRLYGVEISKSRENFISGNKLVEELRKEGVPEDELKGLTEKIDTNKGKILGEIVSESRLWLDLTLISDGFNSNDIVRDENEIYVLDTAKKLMLNIDSESKKSKTLKVPSEINSPLHVVSKNNNLYVLADDGIYDFSKKLKVVEKTWAGEVFPAAYGSNLYLLDSEKGEISKSAGSESGFSEPQKWTTAEKLDFSDVRSFVVDGFSWVLKGDGEIMKFSYGNKINFELRNYPFGIPDYDVLYTSEEAENLYLLDREERVVSVFDKSGEYKYNLSSDTAADTKSFVVDETDKSILLLTGEKLYSLALNN